MCWRLALAGICCSTRAVCACRFASKRAVNDEDEAAAEAVTVANADDLGANSALLLLPLVMVLLLLPCKWVATAAVPPLLRWAEAVRGRAAAAVEEAAAATRDEDDGIEAPAVAGRGAAEDDDVRVLLDDGGANICFCACVRKCVCGFVDESKIKRRRSSSAIPSFLC